MIKQFFRKTMKNIATYVELVLSAFLVFVIAILIIKLVGQCFFDIWHDKLELEYYMEYAMSLAIGVEFVKMLCTHQPGTIIEVLLFATARQMIVEHLNVYETLVGIGAIAALFTIRKFLFCSFDEADHMICRGSQTVAHANLITGAKIPEEKTRILRNVISDKLSEEGKTVAIGACVYYKDCALRVDSMREGMVTRVEVKKNLKCIFNLYYIIFDFCAAISIRILFLAQAVVMGCKRYLSLLVIVSKEFVGYLLAAIGPIALGKIYDVCHSWTMPLVLLQAGDTVVFKDLYRFTREAENGYKKYMEWLDRGINMVFLDNPTVSSDYIRQMMTTAEQQDIVTKTAMESIIKLLIIVELDRGEKQRLYISQSIKDGIAASNKKSGRKPGQLDKMSDALREDILKYLSDRSIKQVDLMRKYNISRNTLKKYVYKIQNHNII